MLIPAHTWTLTGCFALQDMTSSFIKSFLCTGAYSLVVPLAYDNNAVYNFQLYTALVSENHVGKVVASMLQGKVQPLLFIHVPYELAVGAPPECPTQRHATSKNGS